MVKSLKLNMLCTALYSVQHNLLTNFDTIHLRHISRVVRQFKLSNTLFIYKLTQQIISNY